MELWFTERHTPNVKFSIKVDHQLYSGNSEEVWVCMNCGFILSSSTAPEQCPVCGVPQGYYIRLNMTEWGINGSSFTN